MDETTWNVLMRHCRRPWGLVAECYAVAKTRELVCFQQTASTLTPWEVYELSAESSAAISARLSAPASPTVALRDLLKQRR